MTTDVQKAQNVHATLLRVGMAMTLTRPSSTPATYDPATGVATAVAPLSYTVQGVKPYPYMISEIDGTHILQGDLRVLMSTIDSVMPQPGDTLTAGTTVYRVMRATSLGPGTVDILYDVQVRK